MLVRHKGSKKFCKLALQVVKSHNENRSIRKKKIRRVFVAGLSFRTASVCTNLMRLRMRLPCDFFTRGSAQSHAQSRSNPSRTQATNRLTSNQQYLTAPKARPINTYDSNKWITHPGVVFSFPADCNSIACNNKRLLHNQKKMHTFALTNARMAESVDATVSNTVGVIRAGSTPAPGTGRGEEQSSPRFFCGLFVWLWLC